MTCPMQSTVPMWEECFKPWGGVCTNVCWQNFAKSMTRRHLAHQAIAADEEGERHHAQAHDQEEGHQGAGDMVPSWAQMDCAGALGVDGLGSWDANRRMAGGGA